MPANRPIKLRSGGLLHGGIPRAPAAPPSAFDSLVRGVVVATYEVDSPSHPLASPQRQPVAIACDVLCYGTLSGGCRYFLLPGCTVCQPLGGVHSGVIHKPRAATRMLDGTPLSDTQPLDVAQMDGDHVAILCVEGNRNQPIIIGSLPHPSADAGNSPLLPSGARQQMRMVDGDPLFMKHHGSFLGISDAGDVVADASRANDGSLTPTGGDVPNAAGGNVVLRTGAAGQRLTQVQSTSDPATPTVLTEESLAAGSLRLDTKALQPLVDVLCQSGNGLHVQGSGAAASAQVGDGAAHVALAEAMQAWFDGSVRSWLASHQHVTAVGNSSPPTTPPPSYNPSITSGAVSVPSRSL